MLNVDISGIQNSISWLSLKCLNTGEGAVSGLTYWLPPYKYCGVSAVSAIYRQQLIIKQYWHTRKVMPSNQMSWARQGLALLCFVLLYKSASAASIPGDKVKLWFCISLSACSFSQNTFWKTQTLSSVWSSTPLTIWTMSVLSPPVTDSSDDRGKRLTLNKYEGW